MSPSSTCLSLRLTSGPLLSVIAPGQTCTSITATFSGVVTTTTKPLCSIYQTPVLLSTDPSSTILVVLGRLRKGVLLTPDSCNDLKTTHFLIPGNDRLSKSSITLQHANNTLTITDTITQNALTINYTPQNVIITPPSKQSFTDPTKNLRKLLHAIDKLTAITTYHTTITSNLDNLITSYNTLLSNPPSITTPYITTTPKSLPILHQPPPILGNIVYLEVTASPHPKHWFIKCTTQPHTHPTQSSLQPSPKTSLTRVITLPLEQTVSFPITLSSHSPLNVTLSLIFQSFEIPVSTTLLDILDYSYPTQSLIEDSSHNILTPNFFNNTNKSNIITTRLQLPLSKQSLPITPASFKTVLNGIYNISILDTTPTTITIQGPPHITPFVRAAILRRVLRGDQLTPLTITGAPSITRWKKRIVDSVNDWLPGFRRAETALVNVKRLYERVEQGKLEECYGGREGIVYGDAVMTARASYGMLRRNLENLWSVDSP